MADTRFVKKFSIRSLLVMLVLFGALGAALTWRVQELYLRNAALTADTLASGAILGHFGYGPFPDRLTAEQQEVVESMLDRDLRGAGVFAVKLWNREGTLIHSSDPSDRVGQSFAEDPEVAHALAGETAAEIIHQAQPENVEQFEYAGSLLEVYAPVEDPDSGAILGIFETYQHFEPIRREIMLSLALLWGFIALGSGTAYLVQLRMVRSMAEELSDTEAQVAEVNSRLESSFSQLEEHSLGTLQALTVAVDAKDSQTASHSLGVSAYVRVVGSQLKLDETELDLLERAALLHDIGKIGVPETILLKPAKLSEDEKSVVANHSSAGAQIVESIPFLKDLVPLIRHHHEHWNGEGYPDGLSADHIPRLARVLAVADAFDAMTSDRPYRSAMRVGNARLELLRGRGAQFDPAVVDAFIEAIDRGTLMVRDSGTPSRTRSSASV